MSDQAKTAATPVPAATVLLVRNGPDGMEVFMVVRHHQIDFASGALVFPGGKTDPADFDPELRALSSGAAPDAEALALQLSGIRECFEECGVLLARDARDDEPAPLVGGERLRTLQQYRDPLNAGTLKLKDFAEQHQLRFAADRLTPFARWITPPMMPKRFDTWFYLVDAPEDQLAIHDGQESVDSLWIRPQDAVAAAADGSRTIIFPTLRNLEKLALHTNVQQAMAAAAAAPIVAVEPWTERRGDESFLCIPTNAGYPVTEECMPPRG
ncbi:MAG: NUDIX hydrolase [Pseudomonadota bacterium]